jgi:hypothetical protein
MVGAPGSSIGWRLTYVPSSAACRGFRGPICVHSNHIRGVLKTFGMLPGARRGLPFDRRVDATDQEYLAQIPQAQLVAQAPEHHDGDDVGRKLRPVQ